MHLVSLKTKRKQNIQKKMDTTVKSTEEQLFDFVQSMPSKGEPLLQQDRLHMGTIPKERLDVEELYVKSRASFWDEGEIDLVPDLKHWEELSEGERFFLCRVLAFFSQSDALVAENCSCNFGVEITWPEFRQLFAWQASMEWIHARTYSMLLNAYIKSEAERSELETSIATIPTIGAKAAWMRTYMNPAKPLAARLAAFVVCEGVFFSASFCAIFYMKKRGKLPGLAHSNELIARDEGLHTETSALAYSKIVHRLPQAYVHALFADAVAVEREFVRDSIPVSLLGMNADAMCTYVEFVADFWLVRLGYEKLFFAKNPFEWMDLGALTGKTNFFERKVGEYARALREQQGSSSSTSTATEAASAFSSSSLGSGSTFGSTSGSGSGSSCASGSTSGFVSSSSLTLVHANDATMADAFAGGIDF